MDDSSHVKIAKIETTLTFVQSDITEIKSDLKSLKASLENHSNKFSFMSGSWQTITLIVLIGWNILKAIYGK